MHYTICHALGKVSMKFIKEKLSLLYPLFLLLFYFYIRPQFRPLAQYVSNSLASANSYYWTLFGLETIYAEIWLPALIYSGLHFVHHPFSLGAFIIYLLPSLIFGTLYYRSKALLSPILGHILLNLYYTLPLLLSVFQ